MGEDKLTELYEQLKDPEKSRTFFLKVGLTAAETAASMKAFEALQGLGKLTSADVNAAKVATNEAEAAAAKVKPSSGTAAPKSEPFPSKGEAPNQSGSPKSLSRTEKQGLPNPTNCFPAGTLVPTQVGLRPIEAIGSGDTVWSLDFATGNWVGCRVAVCHSAEYDGQFLTIVMESGTKFEVTADHPIWVSEGDALTERPQLKHRDAYEDSGLALPGRWVHSQYLRVGDHLHSREASRRIQEIRSREDCLPVYNLSVLGLPYYSVSPIGILVHNSETAGEIAQRLEEVKKSLADGVSPATGKSLTETERQVLRQEQKLLDGQLGANAPATGGPAAHNAANLAKLNAQLRLEQTVGFGRIVAPKGAPIAVGERRIAVFDTQTGKIYHSWSSGGRHAGVLEEHGLPLADNRYVGGWVSIGQDGKATFIHNSGTFPPGDLKIPRGRLDDMIRGTGANPVDGY